MGSDELSWRKVRLIKDPVWGTFEYFAHEAELLRNPLMVRLNGVKQKSLAHYVVPSAQHTRLLHMWGTAHLSTKACRNGLRNAEGSEGSEFAAEFRDAVDALFSAIDAENRAVARRDLCVEEIIAVGRTVTAQDATFDSTALKTVQSLLEKLDARETAVDGDDDGLPAPVYRTVGDQACSEYAEFLSSFWGWFKCGGLVHCHRADHWIASRFRPSLL